mgnify:CR=1 FL=1
MRCSTLSRIKMTSSQFIPPKHKQLFEKGTELIDFDLDNVDLVIDIINYQK